MYSGEGDNVLVYEGDQPKIAKITGNRAGESFSMEAYSSTGSDSLVHTYDPYVGRVPFPPGLVVIAVTATGPWTIEVTLT